ncbi:DUF819 family protein [Candidatus Sumerlaeota bacterium]|nr:DUF819 family protein [Candidatus Sumerlaeota bacterium]
MRLTLTTLCLTPLLATSASAEGALSIFEQPPITSMNGTIATLLLTVALIYWVADSRLYKSLPIIRVIPAVFLVYFVPMVLNTIGLFEGSTTKALYDSLKVFVLPMSLVLLLVGADLPLIMKMGPKAIAVMLCASVGVVIGGFLAFVVTQGLIDDPDLWRGVGALAGSWIGGSANMIAAKEALQCPQSVFTPMTIIDVICGYGWMIVVIGIAGIQARYDKWNRADTRVIEEINTRMGEIHAQRSKPIKTPLLIGMLGVAALAAHWSMLSGRWIDDTFIHLPSVERLFHLEAQMEPGDWRAFEERMAVLAPGVDASGIGELASAARVDRLSALDSETEQSATIALRTVLRELDRDVTSFERPLHVLSDVLNYLAIGLIFASILGLALSFTPLKNFEDSGASEVGYTLLFLTLASIGSRADLNEILGQEWYLLLGALWILFFAVVLFLLTKIFRAPLFLVATASQANIGGAVSAPIVAGVYQPNLAVVGILMAVLGQVVGTFLAIATGWLCSLVAIGQSVGG